MCNRVVQDLSVLVLLRKLSLEIHCWVIVEGHQGNTRRRIGEGRLLQSAAWVRLEHGIVAASGRFWLLIVRKPCRVRLEWLHWVNRVLSYVCIVLNLDCLDLGKEAGSWAKDNWTCLHRVVRRGLLVWSFDSYWSVLPLSLIPNFDCPFELFFELERHLHEFVDGVGPFGQVKLSNLSAKFQSFDVATNISHFWPVLIVYEGIFGCNHILQLECDRFYALDEGRRALFTETSVTFEAGGNLRHKLVSDLLSHLSNAIHQFSVFTWLYCGEVEWGGGFVDFLDRLLFLSFELFCRKLSLPLRKQLWLGELRFKVCVLSLLNELLAIFSFALLHKVDVVIHHVGLNLPAFTTKCDAYFFTFVRGLFWWITSTFQLLLVFDFFLVTQNALRHFILSTFHRRIFGFCW